MTSNANPALLVAISVSVTTIALLLALSPVGFGGSAVRRTVTDVGLIGVVSIPTGTEFNGFEIGGLSGITYDPERNVYYVVSDDRSAPHFFTVTMEQNETTFEENNIQFRNLTFLQDENGAAVDLNSEGIALSSDSGTLFIASEGRAKKGIPPSVSAFDRYGVRIGELVIPDYYKPDKNKSIPFGIRNNKAFESLTIAPDGTSLYTALENALYQDGPPADLDNGSPVRILELDPVTGRPGPEMVYETDSVPDPPIPPDAYSDNGLVALLALDADGTFLALERSYSAGVGNNIRLYEFVSQGAANVEGTESLAAGFSFETNSMVQKRLLLNFEADLGVVPDNLEAMVLRRCGSDDGDDDENTGILVLVSDNNYNPSQETQFISLELKFDNVSV